MKLFRLFQSDFSDFSQFVADLMSLADWRDQLSRGPKFCQPHLSHAKNT